eukprot:3856862-Amphidinium_carterae.1
MCTLRIGPQPTTDNFVAVMAGSSRQVATLHVGFGCVGRSGIAARGPPGYRSKSGANIGYSCSVLREGMDRCGEVVPGFALCSDASKPFGQLQRFGRSFLERWTPRMGN